MGPFLRYIIRCLLNKVLPKIQRPLQKDWAGSAGVPLARGTCEQIVTGPCPAWEQMELALNDL